MLGTHSYNELAYNGYMLDSMLDSMREERALTRVCPRDLCGRRVRCECGGAWRMHHAPGLWLFGDCCC